METIKNAANYVTESVKGTGSAASKEAHKVYLPPESHPSPLASINDTDAPKAVAKDPEAPLSSRASAAKDTVGDKVEETRHETKADVNKEVGLPSPQDCGLR